MRNPILVTTQQYSYSASLTVFDSGGNRSVSPPLAIRGSCASPFETGASIQPGDTHTFFDGTRTIVADNTTVLTFTLSPLNVDPIYRFTWSGGTRPGFRTDRNIDLSTQSVTVAVSANETISLSASAGSFSAVQVGDEVMIPGVTTGDPAGPFSEANVGRWIVLSKNGTSSTLQMSRPTGTSFSALGQTVTVASAAQVVAMSPGPVRVGDSVRVTSGFSGPIQRSYVVSQVAPDWFEIVTSESLPLVEVGTAGTPPVFYSNAKSFVSMTFDQEMSAEVNGASPQPWSPVSPGQAPGYWAQTGPVWSLKVTNRSAQTLVALLQGAI